MVARKLPGADEFSSLLCLFGAILKIMAAKLSCRAPQFVRYDERKSVFDKVLRNGIE